MCMRNTELIFRIRLNTSKYSKKSETWIYFDKKCDDQLYINHTTWMHLPENNISFNTKTTMV